MFDWNDLRYFLSVADEGSTLKAARTLGANQTTVARRIAALEQALGQKLFERRRSGYTLTPAGTALLPKARAVSIAATSVQSQADAASRRLAGTVRVTCNEIVAEIVLPPLLVDLRRDFPDIRVEVEQSQDLRDLSKGEADIALRYTQEPKGNALIIRKLFSDKWTIYGSAEYLEQFGRPRKPADLLHHRVIGGGGPYAGRVIDEWFKAQVPELEFDTRYDSLTGMLSALRAGAGVTVMPSTVTMAYPELVACWPPYPIGYYLWIMADERSRDVPHVRTIMTALGDRIVQRAKKSGIA